jgi:FixJ family two-component response regulator
MTVQVIHVVDDDEAMRKATTRLLEAAGHQVATYGSARDFLNCADVSMAGCVILDMRLPDQSGLELQAALASQGIRLPVIFMTGYGLIPDTVRAMQGGAVDFLTKPVDAQTLLASVSRAFAQDAASRAERDRQEQLRARYERLTPREREVFLHLISGQLNKQVAADLQIAERTIKLHRANILEKLEVDSMAELARLAVDLGIEPARRC